MAKNYEIGFAVTGGTVLMGKNEAGLYVPVYGVKHIVLAMEIDRLMTDGLTEKEAPGRKGEKLPPEKARELLERLVETKQFIFERNDAGLAQELDLIVQSINSFTRVHYTTLALLETNHGFGNLKMSVVPFVIDSIAWDTERHSKHLHRELMKMYKDADSRGVQLAVITFGGTDSEQWYGGLEAKDIHRRGYFERGHKFICASSMLAFDDNPIHCARVVKGAKRVARNISIPGGAYAVSAREEDAMEVAVFSTLASFIKYGTGVDAFKGIKVCTSHASGTPVSFNTQFHKRFLEGGEAIVPDPEKPFTGETKYARIAPPIIAGNSTRETIALLRAYAGAKKPFDAIIIEGLPGVSGKLDKREDLLEIRNIVESFTRIGTRVIINNSIRLNEAYNKSDPSTRIITPVVSEDKWEEALGEQGFLGKLKARCGDKLVISSQTPNDAYNIALLEYADKGKSPIMPPDKKDGMKPHVFGVRYTPHKESFQEGLRLATESLHASHHESLIGKVFGKGKKTDKPKPTIVISGLPGNCISPAHAGFLRELHTRYPDVEMRVSFDYNGRRRKDGTVEGAKDNLYEAAGACAEFAPRTSNNPQAEMKEARARFRIPHK